MKGVGEHTNALIVSTKEQVFCPLRPLIAYKCSRFSRIIIHDKVNELTGSKIVHPDELQDINDLLVRGVKPFGEVIGRQDGRNFY